MSFTERKTFRRAAEVQEAPPVQAEAKAGDAQALQQAESNASEAQGTQPELAKLQDKPAADRAKVAWCILRRNLGKATRDLGVERQRRIDSEEESKRLDTHHGAEGV